MLEFIVSISQSCDVCGKPRQDKDEILCGVCKGDDEVCQKDYLPQPTNFELLLALRIAKAINSKVDFLRIRNRRTTWVGVEEIALRAEVDKFLTVD